MTTPQLAAEDRAAVKHLAKQLDKNPGFRFFIASKTGTNARGKGAMRSVILGSYNGGKTWCQSVKVWGRFNEKRAQEIVKVAKQMSSCSMARRACSVSSKDYNE